VIRRLLAGPPAILSTGGGAFLTEATRKAIAEAGVALWLDASLSTLWDRVRHKDTRPLLRTPNPRQTLEDIYNRRVPVYALAELRLDVAPHYSIEDTTEAAIAALLTRPDVLEELP
jgi:shikimate kinase